MWDDFKSWWSGISTDTLEIVFRIAVALFVVALLVGTTTFVFLSNRSPDCLEDFAILDPLPNAALFLKQLDESNLVDINKTTEYGWLYIDREIRMTIVIDNVQWSGTPCYLSDLTIFLDIESVPLETGA